MNEQDPKPSLVMRTTMKKYFCPQCGNNSNMLLRDQLGGMWVHLRCKKCDCRFDVKMKPGKWLTSGR